MSTILRYAIRNIIRNPLLSLSSLIVLSLIAFFVNILIFLIYTTDISVASINNRLSLAVKTQPGIVLGNARLETMMLGISGSFSGISMKYISADDALEIVRTRDAGLVHIVESASENPLPNSIVFSQIDIHSYEKLDTYIRTYSDILEFSASTDIAKKNSYNIQKTKIIELINILQISRYGVLSIMVLFILTVATILYNVIWNFVFFHADEIHITDLVGGASRYIYGPFALQGGIFGLLGACIAAVCTYIFFTYSGVDLLFDNIFVSRLFAQYIPSNIQYILGMIGIMCIIGILSGYIASLRYTQLIRRK